MRFIDIMVVPQYKELAGKTKSEGWVGQKTFG